ncbi:hypothetical protein [Streptomyces sp. NPDC050485]|uniref:hypothetical protein n=1 Tax=Streptomyces sp. NPDC050485 TaxID=3365617 RepID=UPI0037BB305E
MSDFHRDEQSLARALKRAADAGGRRIVPEPAERVAARGLRRRRRNLAALAACAVCLLAGSGAAVGLRLQQGGPALPASTPTGGSPALRPTGGSPTLQISTPSYGSPSPVPSLSSPDSLSPSPDPSFADPPPSGTVTPTTPNH